MLEILKKLCKGELKLRACGLPEGVIPVPLYCCRPFHILDIYTNDIRLQQRDYPVWEHLEGDSQGDQD